MLIVFLPLYFMAPRPMKCTNCGKDIASSLSLCEKCEALSSSDPSEGRAGPDPRVKVGGGCAARWAPRP